MKLYYIYIYVYNSKVLITHLNTDVFKILNLTIYLIDIQIIP